MSRIRKHTMGASNIDQKTAHSITMGGEPALAKRKSKARASKAVLTAYTQHVRDKRPHQNANGSREKFIHRTVAKCARPASARMIRMRQKHWKMRSRAKRPASASARTLKNKKEPPRKAQGFRKLLARKPTSRQEGENRSKNKQRGGANAPGKIVKDSSTKRVDNLVNKIRLSCEGKSSQRLFRIWDRDHKGWLSSADVKNLFKVLSMPMKDKEVKILMDRFDTDGDERVRYCEFTQLVRFPEEHRPRPGKVKPPKWEKEPPKVDDYKAYGKEQSRGYNTTKKVAHQLLRNKFHAHGNLRKMFLNLDQERDNSVCFDAFKNLLEKNSIRMPEKEVESMFFDLNKNRDGEIRYEEFRTWLFDVEQPRQTIRAISLRERNKKKKERKLTSKVNAEKVPIAAKKPKQGEPQKSYTELNDSLCNSESATRGAGTHKDRLILGGAAKKLRRHKGAARSAFKAMSLSSARDSLSATEFSKISKMIEKKDRLDAPLLTKEEMHAVTSFLQREQAGRRNKAVTFKDFDRWFLKNHQMCIINGDGSLDADVLATNSSTPFFQRQQQQNSNARASIFRPRSNDMHIWKPHFNFESLKDKSQPAVRRRDVLRNRMRTSTKNLVATTSNGSAASRWGTVSSAIGRGHMQVIRARKAAATSR